MQIPKWLPAKTGFSHNTTRIRVLYAMDISSQTIRNGKVGIEAVTEAPSHSDSVISKAPTPKKAPEIYNNNNNQQQMPDATSKPKKPKGRTHDQYQGNSAIEEKFRDYEPSPAELCFIYSLTAVTCNFCCCTAFLAAKRRCSNN